MRISQRDISSYKQMHATPAGAILSHILKRFDMTQRELAERSAILPQHINAMIKNTRRFTPQASISIEKALGIKDCGFFYHCQSSHDIYLAEMQSQQKPDISHLSKATFWDVDLECVDWQKGKRWAILRVLEYGTESDFAEIDTLYGRKSILRILSSITIDNNAAIQKRVTQFGLI